MSNKYPVISKEYQDEHKRKFKDCRIKGYSIDKAFDVASTWVHETYGDVAISHWLEDTAHGIKYHATN